MTKQTLISFVAKKARISKSAAERAINAFQMGVMKALKKEGDKLILTGYMGFHVVRRSKKPGRNPKTGEPVMIPSMRVVKFKMGDLLKKSVSGRR